ncbi:MAG: hypothetical protein MZU97_25150 [Bacillus subtilis]|nr:hypothetical protein [Bacillus subtilis]
MYRYRTNESITFFEILTLMAFLYFRRSTGRIRRHRSRVGRIARRDQHHHSRDLASSRTSRGIT